MNRVAILADFEDMVIDQRNAALFAATDYIHTYPYPQISGNGYGNIAGIEGDPFYITYGFRIETNPVNGIAPSMKKVVTSIVAIKAGQSDFVIESKTINTSTCLLNGAQQVNYSSTKGYVTYPNDPFNTISLVNDNSKTIGTMQGYNLKYPFVLRYDYWDQIITNSPQGTCFPINNDLPNVNNSWHNLIGNGWSLVLRVSVDVSGYDGYVTTFQAQTPITLIPINKLTQNLNYSSQIIYYDDANAGAVISGVKSTGTTRIRAIFTPNGYSTSGLGNFFGLVFVDIPGTGGIFSRRVASSELPSETGSPFAATPTISEPANTFDQYAHGNVRIGWFKRGAKLGQVLIETNFTPIKAWAGPYAPNPIIRLGFQPAPPVIADATDTIITDTSGDEIEPML